MARTTWHLATFIAAATIGCQQSPTVGEDASFHSESAQVQFVSWTDAMVVQRLQYAAHNSIHHIGTYSAENFSASTAHRDMRARDEDRGCEGRNWSSSKQGAVEMFQSFVAGKEWYPGPGEAFESPEDEADALALVTNPNNRAVFASHFDAGGNQDSESCLYYHYWVYRADGTVIRLEFDYTD